ncbi:MAG: 1-deoxy-D-xylulose-5-phosphate reductoisomerase [Ruminococcaceae bacterium]|nr:1-deoxy-D-xylulose-5-phosphate reductoisomerase [Oscillospiraceae bacterium]
MKLCILGSTGSIGTQALESAENLGIQVGALAAGNNVKLLEEQCRRFSPKYAYIGEKHYGALKTALSDTAVQVVTGDDVLNSFGAQTECDTVLNALTGIRGLRPTVESLKADKTLALANKETLVAGGSVVMPLAKNGILPVDSEHSAIFQCLQGQPAPKKLILTASGGPFFGKGKEFLRSVTPADALKHPNWSMGSKVTIDSATMMNKGLELIEAMHLFGVSEDKIEVIIHRESIIHSMAVFADNAVIAQMGVPDMRLCIQYALTYPERQPSLTAELDFATLGGLSFYPPDGEAFPLLPLARYAAKQGGTTPAAMNGANEVAVELFLGGKLSFTGISDIVSKVTTEHTSVAEPTIEQIEAADKAARQRVYELIS